MPLTSGKPQEYILVWSGDEPLPLVCLGESITLPPVNVVAVAGQGLYRYSSAVDRSGRPLPGTVAISDRFVQKDGTATRTFNAFEWCQMLEQNQKALFQNGFDITVNPDEVAAIQEKGVKLYDQAMLKRDESIVQHALGQASYWKDKGKPQPPSTQDDAVKAAIARLNKRRAEGRYGDTNPIAIEDMQAALGLAPKTAAPAPAAPQAPAGSSDLDLAAEALFTGAREAKLRLKDAEIEGLIKRDPKIMEQVQQRVEAAEATAAV